MKRIFLGLLLGIFLATLAPGFTARDLRSDPEPTTSVRVSLFDTAFAQNICNAINPVGITTTVTPSTAFPNQAVTISAAMCRNYTQPATFECEFQFSQGTGPWQPISRVPCTPEGTNTTRTVTIDWPANFGSEQLIGLRSILWGIPTSGPAFCTILPQTNQCRISEVARLTRTVPGQPTLSVSPATVTTTANATYTVSASVANAPSGATFSWSWDPVPGHPTTGACGGSSATSSCSFRVANGQGGAGYVRVTITAPGASPITLGPELFRVQLQGTAPPVTGSGPVDNPDCGCQRFWSALWGGVAVLVRKAICEATCAVSIALGGLVEWMINGLIDVAGISYEQNLQFATRCWAKDILVLKE